MNVARVRVAFAIIAIAAIVAANGPSLLPEPAAAQAGLFTEPSGQPDTPPVTSRAVVRERVVDVNFPLFDSMARSGPGTTLNLNLFKAQGALFPDVSLTATGGRVERTSSGQGTIWAGRVADDPYSSVTLVAENGVMAGDVRAHGHVYHIRYTGSGAHVISELDPGAFPPD